MNVTEGLPNRENILGGKNGKSTSGAPSMRAKSRALTNVSNVETSIQSNISKAERQRLNAEKLSKGYSVVTNARDKENNRLNDSKKEAKKENLNTRRDVDLKKDFNFKQPLKGLKPRKAEGGLLLRSSSLSVLPQSSSTQVAPKIEVKAATSVSDISSSIPDFAFDDEKDTDEFTLGIYVRDVYSYLRSLEVSQAVREAYITSQHLMTVNMREVLVDWMFEVQVSFQLLQDTTQMAVALLDRYMQDTPKVQKDELQLVAVSCLLIASKYEEMYPPTLDDLVTISAKACTREQIIRTEMQILRTLKFNLGRPTPITFLRRYCRISGVNSLIYSFAKYFMDLGLVKYRFCYRPPSLLAAAALYLALFLTSDQEKCTADLWCPRLEYFSGYSFKTIYILVPQLARLVISAPALPQRCVHEMYSRQKKYNAVSVRGELSSLKLKNLAASARVTGTL